MATRSAQSYYSNLKDMYNLRPNRTNIYSDLIIFPLDYFLNTNICKFSEFDNIKLYINYDRYT